MLLVITFIATLFFGWRLVQVFILPLEQWPIDMTLFAELLVSLTLLLLLLLLLYRLLIALTLHYTVDRNAVTLGSIGPTATVPLERILHIDSGLQGATIRHRLFQGLGAYWGSGRTAQGQPLYLFTSMPPSRSLILVTEKASYALSPAQPERFLQELDQRRQMGPSRPVMEQQQSGSLLFHRFWDDPIVRWAIMLAVVLYLALLALLALLYPTLPPLVPMHFDPSAAVVGFAPRSDLLLLALAVLLLTLANTALALISYRRDRVIAYTWQCGAVMVQLLFAIALGAALAG